MLFLVDLLLAVGLLFAAWMTAKATKTAVPSSQSRACLKFWVLFSLVHFVSQYVTLYMRELKCLLILGCFLPSHGATFSAAVYSNTAQPFMEMVGTPAATMVRTARRFAQTTVSALSRNALSSVVPVLLTETSTEELGKFEMSLERCIASLQSERQRRRTMQLARSAFWRNSGSHSQRSQGGGAAAEGKDSGREEHAGASAGDEGGSQGSAMPAEGARSPQTDSTSSGLSELSVPEGECDSLLEEPTGGSWTLVRGGSAVKRPPDAAGRSLRKRGGRRYKSMPAQAPPQEFMDSKLE